MSPIDEKPEKPVYWRSLAELEDKPEFREFVEREFPSALEAEPPNSPARRRFMQLMGASFALAGAVGCRFEEEKILPYSRRPEGLVPGVPRYYATTMDVAGNAVALHAKSFDQRPIKLEGNPEDPSSLGATNTFHQASILSLYDPDRSQGVVQNRGKRSASSWEAFFKFAREHFAELRKTYGKSLRVLSEGSSSPSLADMKRRFDQIFPQAKWVQYEPSYSDSPRQGAVLAFGEPVRVRYRPEAARVIVSLDSDFVSPTEEGGIAYARAVADGRDPEAGVMNRIYVVESGFSQLGSMADHRLSLRSELIPTIAAYLDSEVSAKAQPLPEHGAAQPKPQAKFLADQKIAKLLSVLVKDLLANVGKSLIVAGPQQPPEVHALVHRLNHVLGNVGNTVVYLTETRQREQDQLENLKALVEEMGQGQVDTLLILGGNPVFTAPSDVPFESALAKVKHSIHLSLYEDETSQRAAWHLPSAHYLETWGDAESFDGSLQVAQPLIAPLFGGKSAIELLATLIGDAKTDARDIVRRTLRAHVAGERGFRKAVHDGRVERTGASPITPKLKSLKPVALTARALGGLEVPNGELELVLYFDSKVHDGRFANNAWLQELPDPITKLTWDNAALIAPATAERLGVEDGGLVKLTLDGRSITIPALHAPGQAEGSVRVALGYGRTAAGHVGGLVAEGINPVGSNAYPLRSSKAYYTAAGLKISKAGDKQALAVTQDLHAIDPIGRDIETRLNQLVREGTLKRFKEEPTFAQHAVHHPPLLSLWQPPVSYDGHRWGMTVDIGRCMGCNSCTVACQAENNVPVVGKERVLMGREMHWLRIDRYYKGSPDDPEIAHQPLLCQQCENAPCEQVCPVGATMHSKEGLNDMVYNRCIGTRYCSNNCPYKVRRFNYFNFNLETYGTTPFTGTDDPKAKVKAMVFNPDVTVRSRGVMEKCTFCVQRIQRVKIEAKNEKRPIKDGEIKSACQQACPTNAIVFGDLNDKQSQVAKGQNSPRAYELLGELNNKPRLEYLARIRNPHPELS